MGDVVEKVEAAGQGSAFVEAEAEANRIAAAGALSVVRGSECVSLPVPERVLWLAAGNQPVVVSVGEPAIFAAPGGEWEVVRGARSHAGGLGWPGRGARVRHPPGYGAVRLVRRLASEDRGETERHAGPRRT